MHNHDLFPKYLNNKFNECNDNPTKIKVPINKIKFGEVGYKFEKYFKNHGVFEGCVTEKNRRCWYSADNDCEDLSISQLKKLKRVTLFFLTLIKSNDKLKKLKEFQLPSVDNVKVGDIGFRFKKYFNGYGIFEGQVIEIKII